MGILGAIGAGIGGVVSGISSLFGGSSTNKTNLKIARETNAAQMELAKYQADQNYKLWEANNAYNTPEAQMQRYQEAGLNPHLIYGNGSSSAGNSSSPAEGFKAPNLISPTVDYNQTARGISQGVQSAVQVAMNGLMQAANIRKANAETQSIYQNTENLKVDNALKNLMVIKQNLENSKSSDEAKLWSQLLYAKISNLDSGAMLSRSQAELADSNRFTTDVLRPLMVQEKKAQVDNIIARTIGQRLENKLNPLRREMLVQQIAEVVQRVKESGARIGFIGSQTSESFTRTKNISLDNQLKSILVNYGLNLSNDELDRLEYQLHNLHSPMNEFRTAKYGARFAGSIFGK